MEEFKEKVKQLAELKREWEDSKAEQKRAELLAAEKEKAYLEYSATLVADFKSLGFEELKIDGEQYKVRKAIENLKVTDKAAAKKFGEENGKKFYIEVQSTGTMKKFVKDQLAAGVEVPDFFAYDAKEYVKAGKGLK